MSVSSSMAQHSADVAEPPERLAFAPASVGNVGPGFDLLGHTVAGVGDQVRVRRIEQPTVIVEKISGCVPDLPLEAERNTAGQALISLRHRLNLPYGFALSIEKGIPLGSGLGGSAASCVAALVAANALLDQPLSREQLYPHALAGEAVASGSAHGDNVGCMLLGGLVLASAQGLTAIPVPAELYCAVVHPDQILETRRAREALQGTYLLHDVVAQSGHLAQLLCGCWSGDWNLIRAGLRDKVVEPRRAPLIPGFARVQRAALDAGALGATISGAGPSVFAWFQGQAAAQVGATMMQSAFAAAGYASESYVGPVAGPRAEVLA